MTRVDEITMTPGNGKTLVATFDERHLTVLLFEAVMSMKHSQHQTLDEAYDDLAQTAPHAHAQMRYAAKVALEYVAERFREAAPEHLQ